MEPFGAFRLLAEPLAMVFFYSKCVQKHHFPIYLAGNGVRHINGVKLRRARLVQGLVTTFWRAYHPGIYPGPLSLAIPPWVGAMSTGDGFSHLWEKTAPLRLRPYGAL